MPVVVAGFEPLDILAALVRLTELIRDRRHTVENMFPRCVTREGNLVAQRQLWDVFAPAGGRWRGIAHVPNGNLRLRDRWAHLDARRQFAIDLATLWDEAPSTLSQQCVCGEIMSGLKTPGRLPAVRRRMPARTRRSARAWSAPKAPAGSGASMEPSHERRRPEPRTSR